MLNNLFNWTRNEIEYRSICAWSANKIDIFYLILQTVRLLSSFLFFFFFFLFPFPSFLFSTPPMCTTANLQRYCATFPNAANLYRYRRSVFTPQTSICTVGICWHRKPPFCIAGILWHRKLPSALRRVLHRKPPSVIVKAFHYWLGKSDSLLALFLCVFSRICPDLIMLLLMYVLLHYA